MPKHFFLFITAGTLLMIVVMIKTGKPLKTAATPHGILNLEFACNSQQANDVIKAWQVDGKMEAAKKNTQYDFNFILFYTLFLTFGCRMVGKRFEGRIQKIGMILSGCAIAAGLLDVMENFGMLQTLHGHVNDSITLFTVICSGIKWILALAALLYFVIFGLISLRKKAVT
jgi:hypothetical protein